MSANTVVTRTGSNGPQKLTERVWDMLDSVGLEFGVEFDIVQGGFKGAGGGASASGSTHDAGDVYDIRVRNIPRDLQVPIVVRLREWSACAWLRDPAHGWTETGPHIHGVQRDSYYPLSKGALSQVASYDAGRNGLANGAVDTIAHPVQSYYWYPHIAPPIDDNMETLMFLATVILDGKTTFWLVGAPKMNNVGSGTAQTWTGPRLTVTDLATWRRFQAIYPVQPAI